MPNPPIDPTLRKQQQIQQAYSGRRARLDAIKAQEPQYDPSMPASLANMPPSKPVNPNNPPLPQDWKPPVKPVNPNNLPLPKDWKPPVNPNNPVLPQDWAPPGGIPARSPSRMGPPAPPGVGGTSGGYHLGTDIPAPPPPRRPGAPIRSPAGQQPPQAPQPPGQPQPPQAPQPPQQPQQPGAQQPEQQSAPYNPLYPTSPTNLPPEIPAPDLGAGDFGPADRASNLPPGGTQQEYKDAIVELNRSMRSVADDKRFSPEQRAQAIEKIRAEADRLKQAYSEAKPLDSVEYGLDAPPPEEFAEVQQGTGLRSTQDGGFLNTTTGDTMPSARAANGQLVPVPGSQSAIDKLPPGTRYIDQAGKLQMTPAADGGQGRSASAGTGTQRAAGGNAPMNKDEALAAYDKWDSKQDPASTPSERRVIADAVAQITDPNQREQLTEMIKSDPEAALAVLQGQGMDLNDELEQARIQEWAKQEKSKVDRSKRVAKEMGIEVPEEKKPSFNPEWYRIEQGSRTGSRQGVRRGSKIAIPLIEGPNGEDILAPTQMRQLADLEVDTEFANIVTRENGDELRVLPFSQQTVNLGNFALNDAQRKLFSKEASNIRARPPEEWAKLEDLLQKFQTTDEAWDPENSNAQAQLEAIVGNFYGELDAPGRAMMTMYIAHSLGYKIDKGRGFDSTGWAKNPDKANKPSDGRNLPTNNIASELGDKLYKIGFADVSDSELQAGGGRTPQYTQGINEMAQNIFTVAQEMEGRAQSGSEQARKDFGNKYRQIDRMVESVAKQNGFGNSVKGKLIVEDLRKRLRSMMGENAPQTAPQAAPRGATNPSAPAQSVSRPPASTASPQQDRPMQLKDTGAAPTSGSADLAMRSKQRANEPAAGTPPLLARGVKPDLSAEVEKWRKGIDDRIAGQRQQQPSLPPDMNWKPEEVGWLDSLFGSGSKTIADKSRLRTEYERLQEQIVKAQDLFDRNPQDLSSGRSADQTKRDLAEFVKTKGASFQQKDRKR